MTNEVIKREEFGDVAVLHIVTTSVDAISAAAIEAACTDMRPITVLDFADVAFINSAGISALLTRCIRTCIRSFARTRVT